MESLVQVIDAAELTEIFDIPEDMVSNRVEVTIRPIAGAEQPKETITDRIEKFKSRHQNDTLRDYLRKKTAQGVTFAFDAQKVIDSAETEADLEARYKLGKQAWARHITETAGGKSRPDSTETIPSSGI
jgi:FKBP-type peptidyl-prolyl cis-trans isomerase (trigger factor)